MGAYHLAKKIRKFRLKENETVIVRKIRWEIIDYLSHLFPFGT